MFDRALVGCVLVNPCCIFPPSAVMTCIVSVLRPVAKVNLDGRPYTRFVTLLLLYSWGLTGFVWLYLVKLTIRNQVTVDVEQYLLVCDQIKCQWYTYKQFNLPLDGFTILINHVQCVSGILISIKLILSISNLALYCQHKLLKTRDQKRFEIRLK